MSHKGNDIFKETLRENRVEKVYEAIIPDRCYTTYDRTDRDEVMWRLQNCFGTTPKPEPKPHKNVVIPKSDDEDYWREREEIAKSLREVYQENKKYNDL